MADLPFVQQPSDRRVAKEAVVTLKNRFIEPNGTLNDSKASAISRPVMKKWIDVGSGYIRKVYSAPGTFNDDLFVVSGYDLYRVTNKSVATLVGTISTQNTGGVSMAATAPLGTVPSKLYIAEGGVLWVYIESGQASGQLTASAIPVSGDTVQINTTYYKFLSSALDGGAPAGTAANPWNVKLGITTAASMSNLYNAINASGVAGTDYSTALVRHTTVYANNVSSNILYVSALTYDTLGNAIVTLDTSAVLSWASGTLTGGGTPQLRQVKIPDDAGAVSLAHINSYIIIIPAQTAITKGRFYWIKPGETTIDPLAYATAERSPDALYQVIVFGDMFWLLGQNTSEAWITSGDSAAPMQRFQGILYDRGSWAGSAVQVKESVIVVDQDGAVFQVAGGLNRISDPGIEERVRRAMQKQALSLLPV